MKVVKYGVEVDLSHEHKTACPRCRQNDRDRSGDNLHVYGLDENGEHLGAKCFSCQYVMPSTEWLRENKPITIEDMEYEIMGTEFNKEVHDGIKSITSFNSKNYRGITPETSKHFGVRYEHSQEDGSIVTSYYPITKGVAQGVPSAEAICGMKVRKHPKTFSAIGETGKETDLFMQFRFPSHRGILLICAGEIDSLSAYQILKKEYDRKGDKRFDEIAVVSPTTGEGGSVRQLKNHYNWLDRFSKIIVCYDNDDAGRLATKAVASILPRGKAHTMNLRLKDVNEYLEKGKEREFISDFWGHKPWTPSGVVSSVEIYDEIVARAKTEKLPFPPVLNKLNKMLAGGINYGYIMNILAGSGSGKSSLLNQCCAFWMQEMQQKVCVLSLEAEAGEYGENLLSYVMGKKISLIEDSEERLNFVNSDLARQTAHDLFHDKSGNPLLYLVDDRGDYSGLQEKVEEIILTCDVRIVLIDVVSDIFSTMTMAEVDAWMAWEKKIVKQYNCVIANVSHVRKSNSESKSASQGAFLTEESIIGSGTQYRSAGINIALQRDKTAECPIERNTTTVHLLKSRATGMTGKACEMFYDTHTHTLHDKEEYMEENPHLFVQFQ